MFFLKHEVKRSDVLFECKGCGHKEDRDVKAAKTIMLFGKIASLDFVPTDHRAKLVEIGTSTSDAFEHLKQVSVVEARRLDAKASS
jgi:transposase